MKSIIMQRATHCSVLQFNCIPTNWKGSIDKDSFPSMLEWPQIDFLHPTSFPGPFRKGPGNEVGLTPWRNVDISVSAGSQGWSRDCHASESHVFERTVMNGKQEYLGSITRRWLGKGGPFPSLRPRNEGWTRESDGNRARGMLCLKKYIYLACR